jgi:hypothetical protein
MDNFTHDDSRKNQFILEKNEATNTKAKSKRYNHIYYYFFYSGIGLITYPGPLRFTDTTINWHTIHWQYKKYI